jgi:hypothetical protein
VATGIDAAAVREKKQAYEEMSGVRIPPLDVVAPTISPPENIANPEEKSAPISTNIKNAFPEENDSTKKRPPSLFERLTGIKRSSPSERTEDLVVQQSSRPTTNVQDEDLEIPAFLRKNS